MIAPVSSASATKWRSDEFLYSRVEFPFCNEAVGKSRSPIVAGVSGRSTEPFCIRRSETVTTSAVFSELHWPGAKGRCYKRGCSAPRPRVGGGPSRREGWGLSHFIAGLHQYAQFRATSPRACGWKRDLSGNINQWEGTLGVIRLLGVAAVVVPAQASTDDLYKLI